jgi:hypothetical protein
LKVIKGILSKIPDVIWPKQFNQLESQKTFYPRKIGFEDIDSSLFKWATSKEIIFETRKVPVFYLTAEKWAEFQKRWTYMDGTRNIEYPFITLRRTNFSRPADAGKGTVPFRKFGFYRIPIHTNAGTTYKTIRVPQPIRIDLIYELRVLTHKNSDINAINEEILRHFASIQSYLDIDKHYMPIEIESVSDESLYEADKEKIHHTVFTLKVKGYLLNEKDFSEEIGVASILINVEEY